MRISDWSSDVCSSDLRHIRSSAPIRNRALTTQFIDDMVFWNLGQSRATGASSRESDVMSLVEYEHSAGIGRLILNRPEAGNTVNPALITDLDRNSVGTGRRV